MNKLFVYCKQVANRGGLFDTPTFVNYRTSNWCWRYAISESKAEHLMWLLDDEGVFWKPPKGLSPLLIPRAGGMAGTLVTPNEAEVITGLSMPAAMDRLRELVHESGG